MNPDSFLLGHSDKALLIVSKACLSHAIPFTQLHGSGPRTSHIWESGNLDLPALCHMTRIDSDGLRIDARSRLIASLPYNVVNAPSTADIAVPWQAGLVRDFTIHKLHDFNSSQELCRVICDVLRAIQN